MHSRPSAHHHQLPLSRRGVEVGHLRLLLGAEEVVSLGGGLLLLAAFGTLAAGARRSRLRRRLRLVGVGLGGGRSIGKTVEILVQLCDHALEVGHLDERFVARLLLVT